MKIEIIDNTKISITTYSYQFEILYEIETIQGKESPQLITVRGTSIEITFSECLQIDTIFEDKNGLVTIEHIWKIFNPNKYILKNFLLFSFDSPELLIPAVIFKKNEQGQGAFPKGDFEKKWSFCEDRMPIPGCMLFFDYKHVVLTSFNSISRIEMPLVSVNTSFEQGKVISGFRIPQQESPYSYQGKTSRVISCDENAFLSISDCSRSNPYILKRTQFIFCNTYKKISSTLEYRALKTYKKFIQILFKINRQVSTLKNNTFLDWQTWVDYKLKHLFFLYQNETTPVTEDRAYIKMGKENGNLQHIYEFTGASFLVKSIEAALIFAKTGNSDIAQKIGSFFLQAESSEYSGIFRDNYDITKQEWGGYLGVSENSDYKFLINSRCNGEAMSAYIQLYAELLKQGIKRNDFLDLVKRVALFYIKYQLNNGSFGRWWTKDGKPVNATGTNGAYIVSMLIALSPYCDVNMKQIIHNSLLKAANWYGNIIENSEYYGDTLDADTVDKEAGAVLLRMSLDMYEYTGDYKFINNAKKIANFLLTWVWMYDVVFPLKTPLSIEQFKTTGLTSVSVAHHHLDFYGIYIARDFFRLSKILTDDNSQFYKNIGLLMLHSCRQLVAQENNNFGRGSHFVGWQPEQINYTQWDYFDRPYHQKGFFDICIAWVPVLTLGAYFQIKDESPDVFK